MNKYTITQEYLKKLLNYDAESGVFTWIHSNSNRSPIGSVAGTIRKEKPYVIICIDRQFFYAHRLAWLYVYGSLPNGMLDHIDGNHFNNRISNLRLATYSQNEINKPVRKGTKSGFKGVWKSNQKWCAYIGTGQERKRLGLFNTPEEAAKAYREAAEKMHGEFMHGSLRETV